jgi:GNAT superfamily N-acetyltransferase
MPSCARFDTQDQWHREHYPCVGFDLVRIDGEPAGPLYLNREIPRSGSWTSRFVPEHRGKGVGTALLRDLLAEADPARRRLTIYVERLNRALRFYERLGFSVAADKGVYLFLDVR